MRKKLIAFPFLVFALSLPPTALAQHSGGERLEQTVSNRPLTEVLKLIEEKFKTKIIFSYDDLSAYRVSTHIKASTVGEALAQAIEGLPVGFSSAGDYYMVKANKRTATGSAGPVRSEKA